MKALIVEDEGGAATRLKKVVAEIDESIEWVGWEETIEGTVQWLDKHPAPDVIFMDIHLADGSCFEIFDQTTIDCPVIFTTAYDEYALKAFEQHSLDYVLKPLKKKQLERAINKLHKFYEGRSEPTTKSDFTESLSASDDLRRMLVKVGPKIALVKLEDVAYFYSQNKITFLVTKEGRRYPLDKSLEYVENNLFDESFFRVNRQYIIHMDALNGMVSHTKGRVKLTLKPPIEDDIVVSTERSPRFKKWLTA